MSPYAPNTRGEIVAQEKKRLIVRIVISIVFFILFMAVRSYLHFFPLPTRNVFLAYFPIGCIILSVIILPSPPRRRPVEAVEPADDANVVKTLYEQSMKYGRFGTYIRLSYFAIVLAMYAFKINLA